MLWTKEYRAEYMKKWRDQHKKHTQEYRHKYYLESLINGKYVSPNEEKQRENCKNWRDRNREKYRAYQREYQRKLRQKSY